MAYEDCPVVTDCAYVDIDMCVIVIGLEYDALVVMLPCMLTIWRELFLANFWLNGFLILSSLTSPEKQQGHRPEDEFKGQRQQEHKLTGRRIATHTVAPGYPRIATNAYGRYSDAGHRSAIKVHTRPYLDCNSTIARFKCTLRHLNQLLLPVHTARRCCLSLLTLLHASATRSPCTQCFQLLRHASVARFCLCCSVILLTSAALLRCPSLQPTPPTRHCSLLLLLLATYACICCTPLHASAARLC